MNRVSLLALAAYAALVSACDQVRLPGANGAAPPEPSVEETSVPVSDTDPALTDADNNAEPEGTGETPTVDRDAGPADDTGSGEPAMATTLTALRPTLSLYNASRCALPEGAAPTPTVAAAAGATTLEEPLVGAEAVNAFAAALTSFPGIVKLEPRRTDVTGAIASGHCGAVRIRANWFVTAAHCVDQPYDEIRLIGDAANLRSPAARITAAEAAICHGGYQGTDNGYSNDIALLRLSDEQAGALTNVPIARMGATSLPLAPANYPAGEMAGWGLTRFGGQLSNDLLTTPLQITAVGPAAITVASKGGAGPCIGDSGGPLYVSELDGSKSVVGILSVVEQNRATGQFCAGDYNGRYTNLEGYAGWIGSIIALCDAQPDVCK